MTLAENQSISMESDNLSVILSKILSANINIEPDALWFLAEMTLNPRDLEDIIHKVSFATNFHSHITLAILKQEFARFFGSSSQPEDNSAPAVTTTEQLRQEGVLKNHNACEEPIEYHPPEIENELMAPSSNLDLSTSKESTALPSEKATIPNDDSITSVSLPKSMPSVTETPPSEPKLLKQHPPPMPAMKMKIKRRRTDDDDENFNIESDESEEESPEPEDEELIAMSEEDIDEIERIKQEKRKQWEKLNLRSSASTFRAVASEYPAQVKVIKDPTGKIYAEGKLEEFHALQVDKFKSLKKILSHRPEWGGILDIQQINMLQNSTEVKLVGMVVEKRLTASKNYIITFEDPTGVVQVLVRSDPNHAQLYEMMVRLLPDHVCIVEGFLSINAERKSRIVMANNIIFPDAPHTHDINCPSEDLAVCCISDTHFGSKDWMEKVWHRFVDYLNCRLGTDQQVEQAGKIKYLTIAGDMVDGIGVYPNQENRLAIIDIYEQYKVAADFFAQLPDYIQIIISPGDHDSVRKAIPNPAIPKEFAQGIYDLGIMMVGCPATVNLHGVNTTIFHGTSLIDMNMSIPGLKNEDPTGTMRELIRARHLAPTYGKKTELAPTDIDWLVMDPLPDIFHTGHLHKNGCGWANGVLTVNSGCFQAQTDYMKSFGIDPDIGKPTIVNLKGPNLKPTVIDLYDIEG
jgi:DNA polymerase II small subunit